MATKRSPWTGRQQFLRGEVDKLYVFLPYLKTSEEISLRGIRFFPLRQAKRSRTKSAGIVRDIASLFFLRDDIQINDLAYAVIDARATDADPATIEENLSAISQILSYIYTTPGRRPADPFLTAEHATLYRFVPSVIPGWKMTERDNPALRDLSPASAPHDEENLDGYEAWSRQNENLPLIPGCRIYPPIRAFWLNNYQDLFADIQNLDWPRATRSSPVLLCAKPAIAPLLEERLLRAMHWYCRGASAVIEPDETIVSLAIAFETMLQLDKTGKSSDLCRRISLLIGPVPRLDSWSEQFYRARSESVHEGTPSHTWFLAVDANSVRAARKGQFPAAYYRRLADYARLIFRQCVYAILWGGTGAFRLKFHRLFFHNQQRLEHICQLLTSEDPDKAREREQIADLVGGLNDARFDSEHVTDIKTVLATGALLADTCTRLIGLSDSIEIRDAITCIKNYTKDKLTEPFVKNWDRLASALDNHASSGNARWALSVLTAPNSWEEVLHSFACYASTMGLEAWAADVRSTGRVRIDGLREGDVSA
jgi:hypothetical protein